ncbi:MAG: hypothetical protein ACR2H3_00295 [Acidimicrobiales bacterium]
MTGYEQAAGAIVGSAASRHHDDDAALVTARIPLLIGTYEGGRESHIARPINWWRLP